jgi:hypothetical protein
MGARAARRGRESGRTSVGAQFLRCVILLGSPEWYQMFTHFGFKKRSESQKRRHENR